jgi:prepilin-type N-terminal cleavage/methylation domain-containing protein
MSNRRLSRRGFTLVELLVAMGILLFLAALAVYLLPRMQDNIKVAQAGERLQGWLLNARQRGKRDQLPTGLRLVYDANGLVTQLLYIQQPDDYAQGRYAGAAVDPFTAQFLGAGLSNPAGTLYPAMYGDRLEVYGGPARLIGNSVGDHAILVSGSGATATETLALYSGTTPLDMTPTPSTSSPACNYRIIRQPRPLPGEQPLNFPYDTGIDLKKSLLTDLPLFTAGTPPGTIDILFAPTGSVMKPIDPLYCLYVRDNVSDDPSGTSPALAAPSLIAITTRSGFIAAHPVAAPPADPFTFAKDGRDSGI